MLLNKAGLAALIPHAGNMCLLDGVVEFDDQRILCVSRSHRSLDNPLRRQGHLGALSGLEYAGQAMAVHGGLLAGHDGQPRKRAYLAAIRDLALGVRWLDVVMPDLSIEAESLMADQFGRMYRFRLQADGKALLEGRATLVFMTEGEEGRNSGPS